MPLKHSNKLTIITGALIFFLLTGAGIGGYRSQSLEANPCYTQLNPKKTCVADSIQANIYGGNFMAGVGLLTCCYLLTVVILNKTNKVSLDSGHNLYEVILWSLFLICLIGGASTAAFSWYGASQGDGETCKCLDLEFDEKGKIIRDNDGNPIGRGGKKLSQDLNKKSDFQGPGSEQPGIGKGRLTTFQLWMTRIGGYGTAFTFLCVFILLIYQLVKGRQSYTTV